MDKPFDVGAIVQLKCSAAHRYEIITVKPWNPNDETRCRHEHPQHQYGLMPVGGKYAAFWSHELLELAPSGEEFGFGWWDE